jgi:spore maturation protein CgeB
MKNNYEEELQKRERLEKELADLRSKYEAAVKHYNSLISRKDKIHEQHIAHLEKSLKKSWTWRIGSLVTTPLSLGISFIKNPAGFFARKKNLKPLIKETVVTPVTIPSAPVENISPAVEEKEVAPIRPVMPPVQRIDNKPVLAAVMDEFTNACFQPECTLITFRPDNWKETLEKQTPEAIFIESAWNGNQGSWQYKIAKYSRNMGDELIDLVNWAKENHIPTIFWNKEDPPNFERFIDKAKLFDYVFTSDEDCIPEYRNHISHNHIYSLPFAAQPVIHNPLGDVPRANNVCFAGTYHADEFLDRQNDMEIILNPAREYGLHIYDRNFGAVGPGSERFRFPDKYQPFIKGRLNYQEMVQAYHQYKVFLNVNSVKDSPTMFSRRVFELLAVGTPVISTYSKGIVELLGDTVFITESEADTQKYLDLLLNDRNAWMKASVRGIRKVMESHTYDRRLEQVLSKTGIDYTPSGKTDIALLAMVSPADDLDELAEKILKQTMKPNAVILISDQEMEDEAVRKLSSQLEPAKVLNITFVTEKPAARILESCPAALYAFWNANDQYGPDYLKDYTLAGSYSNASMIGKGNYYLLQDGNVKEINTGNNFINTSQVPLATLAIRGDVMTSFDFKLMKDPKCIFKTELPGILSVDPLNYIQNGDRSGNGLESTSARYFG